MHARSLIRGIAPAGCVAVLLLALPASQAAEAGPTWSSVQGRLLKGRDDPNDDAGYFDTWRQAIQSPKDAREERVELFERAEAQLNRRDHKSPAWILIDVPNHAEMLCEKETVLSRMGRCGAALVAAQQAEAAMREFWGRSPTEDDLRTTPPVPMTVYVNVLLDRAEHLQRRGDLTAAWAAFEECRRLAVAYLPPSLQRPCLGRILNNHSVSLSWGGRNEASDRLSEEARTFAAGTEGALLAEIGSLRAQCRREAPSEALCAQLRERAGRLQAAGRIEEALMVQRRVASSLHELGRKEDAFKLFEEILSEAVAHQLPLVAADACLWRGKARSADESPAAEDDLFAALDFYRQSGIRPAELRAYAAYARFLDRAGRLPEALAAVRAALDLAGAMGAVWLEPELLALEARILIRLGAADEAERVWAEAAGLLDRLADLDEERRLNVLVERLRQLQARGKTTELAAMLGRAQAFAERSKLSEYQKAPLRDFVDHKDSEEATVGAASPRAPGFQPVYLSTRVRAGVPATAWAWVVNPGPAPLEGQLRAAMAAGVEWNVGPDGVRELQAGGGAGRGTESSVSVRVPAGGVLPLRLVRGASPDPAAATTTLEWIGKERLNVRWDVSGGADAAMFTESVQHSLMAANPFFSLPLYHEVRPVKAAGAVNLRVRASQPCRLEIRDAADRRILGVDANADGSFEGAGDMLGCDADVDGHPDLPPGGGAVVIHAFALPGKAVQGALDVIIEMPVDGSWHPVGMDRILNGTKADRPK